MDAELCPALSALLSELAGPPPPSGSGVAAAFWAAAARSDALLRAARAELLPDSAGAVRAEIAALERQQRAADELLERQYAQLTEHGLRLQALARRCGERATGDA